MPTQTTVEKYDNVVRLLRDTTDSLMSIGKQVGLYFRGVKNIQERAIEEGVLDPRYRRLPHRGIIQWQYDRAVALLGTTDWNLSTIGGKVGVSAATARNVQNKSIEEGILDPKYRRRASGILQWRYSRGVELLKTTDLSLSTIAEDEQLGLSYQSICTIQNRAIREGDLDPKYRRLANGTIQWQYDRSVELLENTTDSFKSIGLQTGLSSTGVRNVQNSAIKKGDLDPKYRRLLGGHLQWQYDRCVELLRTTNQSLTEIGKEPGLSLHLVFSTQNRAIKNGELDPKYKRLSGGIIKWQYDRAVELLGNTNLSHSEIANDVHITSGATVRNIQNRAIQNGELDPKYRRLPGGTIQWQYDRGLELLETTKFGNEKIGEMVELSRGAVLRMQNSAIKNGELDSKYRRLHGMVQWQDDNTITLLEKTTLYLGEIAESVELDSETVSRIQNRAIAEGKLDPSRKRPLFQQNGKIKDGPSFREFVETHEDAQKVVTLFAYEDGTIDSLAGRLLALLYPGVVDEEVAMENLPSLGPYLGRFRRPPPSDVGGDVIGRIPKPIIDRDQMLRGGFLKMGREYYMSVLQEKEYPTEVDEEAFLDLIKENRDKQENETLKWLHGTLYDEFYRFFEITREARKRIPEEVAT